jgi:capsular polysaccharide biosynthesis protein
MLLAVDLLGGAVATPLERPEPGAGSDPHIRFVGGILDAAGAPHLASRLTRRGIALQAPSPAAIDRLQCPGRWLYGGIWFDHYGHFLLETLARAWHLADLPGPVVFHRPPEQPGGPIAATMSAWQRELVNALFGTPSRIHFVTSTMEFEELVVAEAGCVLGDRCTTDQADALARIGTRIAAPAPVERNDRKLWLSRSALTRGCVIGERDFETDLAAAGFEVIHPQAMPLAAQIRAFDEARLVAGFTGSAFHTALMASRRRAELVHFARFTAANDKTFELCAAAAAYPSQFHDCFLGFLPAPPAGTSGFAAALDVRQDFTAVRRILHDSGV